MYLASSCVSKHEVSDTGVGGSDGGTGVGGSGDDNKSVTWKPGDDEGHCNVDALLLPHAYGSKVKTLLTGLPLDDAELGALQQDALMDQRNIESALIQATHKQQELTIESQPFCGGTHGSRYCLHAGPAALH